MHIGFAVEFTRSHRLAQILTLPVAGADPPAVLVAGFGSPRGLSDGDMARLDSLGPAVRELCERTESDREELERLRRLEAVDELLPALFKVLDLREIFDRLSSITKDVIPHDFANVGMFSDNLTELSLFAKTSTLGTAEYTGPMPFPPSQTANAGSFGLFATSRNIRWIVKETMPFAKAGSHRFASRFDSTIAQSARSTSRRASWDVTPRSIWQSADTSPTTWRSRFRINGLPKKVAARPR
jgi:hypothetical protein